MKWVRNYIRKIVLDLLVEQGLGGPRFQTVRTRADVISPAEYRRRVGVSTPGVSPSFQDMNDRILAAKAAGKRADAEAKAIRLRETAEAQPETRPDSRISPQEAEGGPDGSSRPEAGPSRPDQSGPEDRGEGDESPEEPGDE